MDFSFSDAILPPSHQNLQPSAVPRKPEIASDPIICSSKENYARNGPGSPVPFLGVQIKTSHLCLGSGLQDIILVTRREVQSHSQFGNTFRILQRP